MLPFHQILPFGAAKREGKMDDFLSILESGGAVIIGEKGKQVWSEKVVVGR